MEEMTAQEPAGVMAAREEELRDVLMEEREADGVWRAEAEGGGVEGLWMAL
jgi:hypothetical protein